MKIENRPKNWKSIIKNRSKLKFTKFFRNSKNFNWGLEVMETPINFSDGEWLGGYTFHSPNEILFIALRIVVILKWNFTLVWYFSLEWTARYSYLHLWILSQITHFWGLVRFSWPVILSFHNVSQFCIFYRHTGLKLLLMCPPWSFIIVYLLCTLLFPNVCLLYHKKVYTGRVKNI